MKSTAFCSTLADSVHPSQELRLPLSPGQWKAGCTRCEQRDTGAIEQPKVLNESFVGKICHCCAAYLFQRTMGFAKFHLAHWHRINIKLSAQVFASQCCLRRTVRGTAGVSPMKQLLRLCRILRHYAKRSGPNTSRRAHAPGMGRQFLHMTRPAVHSGIMAYDTMDHHGMVVLWDFIDLYWLLSVLLHALPGCCLKCLKDLRDVAERLQLCELCCM